MHWHHLGEGELRGQDGRLGQAGEGAGAGVEAGAFLSSLAFLISVVLFARALSLSNSSKSVSSSSLFFTILEDLKSVSFGIIHEIKTQDKQVKAF